MKRSETGFAGLSNSATDIDDAMAQAAEIAAAPAEAASDASESHYASQATPVHRGGGEIPGGLKQAGAWIGGILVILILKACLGGSLHSGSATSLPSADTSTSEYTDTAASTDDASSGSTTADQSGEESSSLDDATMSKPSAGYETLTLAEVRYCLAEDIRISAQTEELDSIQYSDTGRYNRNVDSFNATISDYNSRCSGRSVLARDREQATSETEASRLALESEGRSRVI